MKKTWLVLGIVSIVVCVFLLLLAALRMHGYYHLLDGDAQLYQSLHQRAIICLVLGIVFAIIGVVSFVIRAKV